MKLTVKSAIAALLFALSITGAAATNHLEEVLIGSWNYAGSANYIYSYGPAQYVSGDSVLLSQSTLATAVYEPGIFNYNCISCTYTSTFSGGDTIFGTFANSSWAFVINPDRPWQVDLDYQSTFTVDGGTGAFAGAHGGGAIRGTHYATFLSGVPQFSGLSIERVDYRVTTAPIPEPESYAMLIAGLILLRKVGRQRTSAAEVARHS